MWVESFDTGARHAAPTRETGDARATKRRGSAASLRHLKCCPVAPRGVLRGGRCAHWHLNAVTSSRHRV